jgi:RNA polymerase sigma factor (sigma-70 family)
MSTVFETDAQLLELIQFADKQNRQKQELEATFSRSSSLSTAYELDDESTSISGNKKKKRILFKGVTTTAGKSRRKRDAVTATRSLEAARSSTATASVKPLASPTAHSSQSSTMPGFAVESDRQRAFYDGIRLVEERTGRKFVDTEEGAQRRRKENGTSMYKNSASVPESMIQYAEELHREDLITRQEEQSLGESVQEAVRLQRLYDGLEAKLHREPTDDEWCAAAGKLNIEMIQQDIEQGLKAKDKLVTSNLRMVQSVVNTYIRNGLTARYNAGDMMQEGTIALVRAAEKFDPTLGWKFSTYGMYWIRAAIKQSQIFQSRIISVPQRLYVNYTRLKKLETELLATLGRRPTRSELAEAADLPELQVERCYKAMTLQCFSLDQPTTNAMKPNSLDARGSWTELLECRVDDGEHVQFDRDMAQQDLIRTLRQHLPPIEVEMLLFRYGFKGGLRRRTGSSATILELSEKFGLKPNTVRKTILQSLEKLKTIGLEEYLSFL